MKKETQLTKIESTVFYGIEKAIKVYRQYAQKNIKKRGIDITIDQWLILKTIHDHSDLTQREIADLVFKDYASITRIVEILVRRSYLTRSFHQEDRRRFTLELTAEGKKIYRKLIPIVAHNRKTALTEIDLDEIESLHRSLNKIIKNCISETT
ncbi:MAG: MarR family transcriptional regulator [Saprospiraceae bacterium]|nr:MarR family transcriptional regulator [Saprospiraceae bacterium]